MMATVKMFGITTLQTTLIAIAAVCELREDVGDPVGDALEDVDSGTPDELSLTVDTPDGLRTAPGPSSGESIKSGCETVKRRNEKERSKLTTD